MQSFALGLCDASGKDYGQEIRSQDSLAALPVADGGGELFAVYRPLGPTPAGGTYGIDYVIIFADRVTGIASLKYIVVKDKIVEADRLCSTYVLRFAPGDEIIVSPPSR